MFNRIFILLCVMFAVATVGYSMGKKPLLETNLLKVQAEEMNAFKNEVKGDIKGLESNIEKMQNDLKANGSAIVGFNNQIKQVNETVSAGRDITNTNDSKLMERIFELQSETEKAKEDANNKTSYMWYAICGSLISVIVTCITLLGTIFKLLMSFFTKYMFYKEQTFLRLESEDEINHIKELQYGKKSKEAK